ncbi:MAG: RNA recognition motif domain-containing protein [Bacillota bacterium]
MDTRLYVGNLDRTLDSHELSQLFEEYGTVHSAEIVTNGQTGQSRGFGFVEMSSEEEALLATLALDGGQCIGRALSVRPADQEDDPPEAPGPRPGGFGDRSGIRAAWGSLS